VERLPGVSHWVQQEAPDAVNALLLDFLDGHRAA
jgi:pimeloyl-ACP methyl ester carboxylesterase